MEADLPANRVLPFHPVYPVEHTVHSVSLPHTQSQKVIDRKTLSWAWQCPCEVGKNNKMAVPSELSCLQQPGQPNEIPILGKHQTRELQMCSLKILLLGWRDHSQVENTVLQRS